MLQKVTNPSQSAKEEKQSDFNSTLLEKRKKELIKAPSTKHQVQASEIYQNMIPTKLYAQHIVSDTRVYGGRFTSRGNYYYCSSQSDIVLFNTQDPYNWQKISHIGAQEISWTVTDMDVDPQE